MPDTKIVNLTEKTATQSTDEFVINDVGGGNVDKKVKLENIHKQTVTTKTSSATLTTAEEGVILLNPSTSEMTITLPAASGNTGLHYDFKLISTTGQPVVIDGNASETIDGKTSQIVEHCGEQMKIICDGTNWHVLEWSTMKGYNYFELIDEFSSAGISEAAQNTGELGWQIIIDGTTNDVQTPVESPDINTVGLVGIGTGAVSGNDWALILGGSATIRFMDSDVPNWSQTMRIRIITITTVTVRLGLAETVTGASWEGADSAFFKFDPSVSANWLCITFGSSTQTTTTSSAVAANTFYKLKIVKDGSTIRFYLDNVNLANHSTQIPSANVNPAMQVQTNTTALRDINIDYFRLSGVLSR